jgi:hypothetical protein
MYVGNSIMPEYGYNVSYTISDRLINKQLFCFHYDKISLQNMISIIHMLNSVIMKVSDIK